VQLRPASVPTQVLDCRTLTTDLTSSIPGPKVDMLTERPPASCCEPPAFFVADCLPRISTWVGDHNGEGMADAVATRQWGWNGASSCHPWETEGADDDLVRDDGDLGVASVACAAVIRESAVCHSCHVCVSSPAWPKSTSAEFRSTSQSW
jgi:hypothetical protein